jgi:predicted secreted hydrolase
VGPRDFRFPQDHGAHPDYQTEWWYYTGNLESENGRRFGYQLTFFRRALTPPSESPGRLSAWGTNQAFLAHFAISDVSGGRYQAFERMARGAIGLAGALPLVSEAPFSEVPASRIALPKAPISETLPSSSPAPQVWLHAWRVEQVEPDLYRLKAEQDGFSLDLKLVDLKGPILQGERGYSQKGPEPGNASYYVSLTRLDTSGILQIDQERFKVNGLSWMDHEYSTSALSKEQTGWDWFALQLNDGSELMVFTLRQEDGTPDPFSSGMLIRADGSQQTLGREDFKIGVSSSWRSPHSQAEYPASWTVEVPAAGIRLEVEPLLADQELNLTYSYWEGAVQVSGEHAGQPVKGYGYVELTGYAGSFAGEF